MLIKDGFASWFPRRRAPIIAGSIPHLKLPDAYLRRPEVRDEIVARLLNIDPQTGTLCEGIVALAGLPGTGKSSMVLEIFEKVRPYFQGGILYCDLELQTPREIAERWCQALQIDHSPLQSLPVLVEQMGKVVGESDSRWLIIVENASDGCLLQELKLPNTWLLLTTYGVPPLQPLGWEKHMFELPPFGEGETVELLKRRLGDRWDHDTGTKKAKELHRLVDGLPMAVGILAAVVRSRGWEYVLERLRDRERAVSVIRYGGGQTTATSLALALDTSLPNLSDQARTLLQKLSFLPLDEAYPTALPEFLNRQESFDLDGIDVEAAQYELMEHLILKTDDEHGFYLHRLAALHVAQHTLYE
jgi:hypothetical protein